MLRKQIYAWIAGIALLIVLLMVIQIVWMKQAALVEKRETDGTIREIPVIDKKSVNQTTTISPQ